jgi:hypothetical protein
VAIYPKGPDSTDRSPLSMAEVIRLAADRGTTLWVETRGEKRWVTDGSRKYIYPDWPGGALPQAFVKSLCERFDLPGLDFALDPRDDD